MFKILVEKDLELRLLLHNNTIEFFEVIDKNRDYLNKFMPRINETKNIIDAEKVIDIFLKQLIDNNGFRTGIFYRDKFIGVIGLKYIDWINKKSEIMYWVDNDYSCKGIITKCVKKVINIGFNHYELNKIILKASVDNKASQRIAEKCEFTYEGRLRQDELLLNGYSDICQYSILKSEFEVKYK